MTCGPSCVARSVIRHRADGSFYALRGCDYIAFTAFGTSGRILLRVCAASADIVDDGYCIAAGALYEVRVCAWRQAGRQNILVFPVEVSEQISVDYVARLVGDSQIVDRNLWVEAIHLNCSHSELLVFLQLQSDGNSLLRVIDLKLGFRREIDVPD